MHDLIIAGGTLVDGSGSRPRRADVAVDEGRIVAIGDLSDAPAHTRLDARDLIVAPGFVDLHSHSDVTLLAAPTAPSKIRQGVTTEVNGNCGMAAFPLPPVAATAIRAAQATIDPLPDVAWSWSGLDDYRATLEARGLAVNTVPLVGHIPLRIAVAGNDARPLATGERRQLVKLLEANLEAGAAGFSTGLMYPPAMSAEGDELTAIGRVVARHDRLFAAHMRNYGDYLLEAVDEMLEIGRRTGCRLQLSHLAVAGRRNWGKVARALETIDRARADGVDVAVDSYPYLAGSANLSQLLPAWAQEGGTEAIVERLALRRQRARIEHEWKTALLFGWDEIEVASLEAGLEDALGQTVEAVGRSWATEPALAALELIRRSHNRVQMVAYGRAEEDLRAVLGHAATSLGSDGLAMDPAGPTGTGRPHPRNFGCFPRFLGRYVRQERLMPLEQAVAMATRRPAERIGLADRGLLADGMVGDLVVFDHATIIDRATFTEPSCFPLGLVHVVIAGVPVVRDGVQADGARPGRVLLAGADGA